MEAGMWMAGCQKHELTIALSADDDRRVSVGTLDSGLSDQDVLLVCEEDLLDGDESPYSRSPRHGSTSTSSLSSLLPAPSTAPRICYLDVQEMIKNEMLREVFLACRGDHLAHHPAFTKRMRCVTLSWLVEVAVEFGLQQETLFLATTYFNRYLTVCQGVMPQGIVQLLAVACISLAAKQEEVDAISAAEWTSVAVNCFQSHDLVHMEWLVLVALDWQLRAPTVHTFLQLFCNVLSTCTTLNVCAAAYFAELSLLDYGLVSHPYSVVAAACLLLALVTTEAPGSGTPSCAAQVLKCCAPSLDLDVVATCMSQLEALHCAGGGGEATPGGVGAEDSFQAQLPVRRKYGGAQWERAALAVAERLPLDPALVPLFQGVFE